jgi:hypothetical protein
VDVGVVVAGMFLLVAWRWVVGLEDGWMERGNTNRKESIV